MERVETLKRIKILFVDDEEFIRKSAVEYLMYYCDHVYEASDGEEAYTLYQEIRPDIIITDIKMPKLNGLELVEKIRRDDAMTQVIITTAHTDTDFLLKAVELKLVKYLIKPVSEAKLMPVLKDALTFYDNESTNIVDFSDGYSYDILNKSLFHKSDYIKLNKKEGLFLDICARNLHRVVTYSELENHVWEGHMSEYALSSLVKSLRAKLPAKSVENISGVGYKIHTT